jgi:hypothetical protein
MASVQRRLPSAARNAITCPDLPAPITASVRIPWIFGATTIGESSKS